MRKTEGMDSEQTFVTTEGSSFYHARVDCPALQRGQNAAETNGWTRHDIVPWTPGSPWKRDKCETCAK